MNNKGQVVFLGFMLMIVIIILAMALAPAIKSVADDARAPTSNTAVGLDCANASISDFDKGNCVLVDSFNPYFIGILIAIGGAIIGARLLYGV